MKFHWNFSRYFCFSENFNIISKIENDWSNIVQINSKTRIAMHVNLDSFMKGCKIIWLVLLSCSPVVCIFVTILMNDIQINLAGIIYDPIRHLKCNKIYLLSFWTKFQYFTRDFVKYSEISLRNYQSVKFPKITISKMI